MSEPMISYTARVLLITDVWVMMRVSVSGRGINVRLPIDKCDWVEEDQEVVVEVHPDELQVRPVIPLKLDQEDLDLLESIVKEFKPI